MLSRYQGMIPYKRRMVTSWPISALWVFLSLSLAILSTFSFLQADWVIKRDLVVTSLYQKSERHDNSTSGIEEVLENREYAKLSQDTHPPFRIDISNYEFSKHFSRHTNVDFENETILYDKNFSRITKVTKVITTIRFGLIGVCTSPSKDSVRCFLYEESSHDLHPVSRIWPVSLPFPNCNATKQESTIQ